MRIVMTVLLLLVSVPTWAGGVRVAVTIPPQVYLTQRIAGDLAQIESMVPPGASPHGYEPRPSQMAALSKADLYLGIGVEFEKTWLPRLLGANRGVTVVDVSAGTMELKAPGHHHGEHDEEHGHGEHQAENEKELEHGSRDPHVWLAPMQVKQVAENIADALTKADPDNAGLYAANLTAFQQELDSLHREIATLLRGNINRYFLVFHPSWGHFAREFGLRQLAVEVNGREPGPRALAGLLDEAKEHGITSVLVAPQFSRKTASIVASELGGGLVDADPMAADWKDNLLGVAARLAETMR